MALRNLTVAIAFLSIIVTTTASGGTAYSLNANSVTTKPLPSDVLSHCYGNTSNCSAGDAVAKCTMTDCGNLSELNNPTYIGSFVKASPGRDDFANPVYPSASTDPWYSITAATPTGSQTETFHAPNAATFSEGAEHELTIWDETTGWVVELYNSSISFGVVSLPAASGCGGTQATACRITNTYQSAASNLFSAQDYGYFSRGSASNGFAPTAAMVSETELQNGSINHALMFAASTASKGTGHFNAAKLWASPGVVLNNRLRTFPCEYSLMRPLFAA